VKGAIHGALTTTLADSQSADGGTIFLDEIGELPLDSQVKPAAVCRSREFEPVGSSKSILVDVAGSSRHQPRSPGASPAGRFRADLYYRLSVVPLEVPPLRARTSDIGGW